MRRKEIILIGDSIRWCYQEIVARETADIAQVWGLPDCGNTWRVIKHLRDWALTRDPDIVHVNSGLHDMAKCRKSGRYYVPLDIYKINLGRILRIILERTEARVILATTTPVVESRQLEDDPHRPFLRRNEDVVRYNAAAIEVATAFGVPVNDLHAKVVHAGPENLIVEDGVHFTAAGSEMLGKAVAEKIRPFLEADSGKNAMTCLAYLPDSN